ncbi:MAG TPA: GNAT family N-acetyltransferase [Candidatus Mediterraneibacter faecavium]|uniref:GNAT family N-acetyltransferase n=1 Tax=Candidatus Mediterraneibacter faecavium TaxID=2838668 RepID=A0A9D2TN42_9FIRM|nr:GNAT family N-acetyltransferase [Candidatus Mediterraneibacter faecavium]
MIRKLTENHRDLYIRMAEEFYSSDAVLHPIPRAYIERTADEALQSDAYAEIYLLECEGEPAGYGLTARTFSQEAGGSVLWIEELYIREQFRSRGLGREFFSYIEEKNKDRTARIRLEVEEENTRAASLYERLGYEKLDYKQMIKDLVD